MERNQLIKKLELMKKEFASKQRKLEKANRAARVKAHVRKKIEEHRLQVEDEQPKEKTFDRHSEDAKSKTYRNLDSEGHLLQVTFKEVDIIHHDHNSPQSVRSDPKMCKAFETKQDSVVSVYLNKQAYEVHKEDKIKESLKRKPKNNQAFDMGENLLKQNTVSNSSLNRDGSFNNLKQSSFKQPSFAHNSKCKFENSIETGTVFPNSALKQVHEDGICTLEIDSLAITPSFRSSLGEAMAEPLNMPDVTGDFAAKLINEDTCTETEVFTLNLASGLDGQCVFSSNQDILAKSFESNDYSPDSFQDLAPEYDETNVSKVNSISEASDYFNSNYSLKEVKIMNLLEKGRSCTHYLKDEHQDNSSQSLDRMESKDFDHETDSSGIYRFNYSNISSGSQQNSNSKNLTENGKEKTNCSFNNNNDEEAKNTIEKCESEIFSDKTTSSDVESQQQSISVSFLDYTELDAIPYSQFELTEDFLSEGMSQLSQQDSLHGRQKKRHSVSLIQRRSPRLSAVAFGFHTTSNKRPKTASCTPTYLSSEKSFTLNKVSPHSPQRKKTKKALLLSSLFQYLIDEANRDKSFVEFCLPSDITGLVNVQRDLHRFPKDPPGCASLNYQANFSKTGMDSDQISVIPESEVDPEFYSPGFHHWTEVMNTKQQNRKEMDCCISNSSVENENNVSFKETSESFQKISLRENFKAQGCDNAKFRTTLPSNINTPKVAEINEIYDTPSTEEILFVRMIKEQSYENEILSVETLPHAASDKEESTTVQTFNEEISNVLNQKKLTEMSHSDCASDLLVSASECHKTTDIFDSLSLFASQPGTVCDEDSPEKLSVNMNSLLEQSLEVTPKDRLEKFHAVFTPLKDKVEQLSGDDVDSWLYYTGCAESGSKEPVIEIIMGNMLDCNKQTAYILSVQSSVLTLWTQDDQAVWTVELQWYLPQGGSLEGACSISSDTRCLAVAVWGMTVVSQTFFITVFIFHWDTQNTLRFNLKIPSSVTPTRLFCHGLPALGSTVLVFSTDKAYTRGNIYALDTSKGCVVSETCMEPVREQLLDVHLIKALPSAVVGLTLKQTILIWNQADGILLLSIPALVTFPKFARMFSCFSHQGYLLLHMLEENKNSMNLVALNPTTAAGKILKQFKLPSQSYDKWCSLSVYESLLLAVTDHGVLHMLDASTSECLSSVNISQNIKCAVAFSHTELCWLVTGQETGCLHIYHFTV